MCVVFLVNYIINEKDRLSLKHNIMDSLLYAIAVILVIIWAIGFFAYSAGILIHVLLVIAFVAILVNITRGRNPL